MTTTNTNQIIIWLRDKAKGAPDHAWQHMMNAAADKLSELQEELKRTQGCGGCKHCREDWDAEPCNTCRQDKEFPAWEWKGATKHG